MVGALSVVGSSVMESHSGPCLCLDSLPTSVKSGGDLVSQRSSMKRKHVVRVELGSSFVDSWPDRRLSSKAISNTVNRKQQRKGRRLVIVNELAGQYEDSFEDVKTQILNYFTYKAVVYDFVVTNKPGDGKRFIRSLGKENHDLAERVMITRLHLYGKWIKKCDHAQIYKEISDENLELMRERLIETVIWPSDDTNTEKIG
ncbi:hypothetical protein LWI29_015301 [Acer saccharum]|uniref:Chaperonin-like RbcX protein 2, chloroplastic n=1 Tax=Acer saccharum TaxID=4024 RepID=A0AA39TEK0_ACESA|nr:hypothetical protein LWI29_015301 [Acer saccharum]